MNECIISKMSDKKEFCATFVFVFKLFIFKPCEKQKKIKMLLWYLHVFVYWLFLILSNLACHCLMFFQDDEGKFKGL